MERAVVKARIVLVANLVTLVVALLAVVRGLLLGQDGDRGRILGLLALVGTAFSAFAVTKAAQDLASVRSGEGP